MPSWKSETRIFPVFLGTTEVAETGTHLTRNALIFPTAVATTGAYWYEVVCGVVKRKPTQRVNRTKNGSIKWRFEDTQSR